MHMNRILASAFFLLASATASAAPLQCLWPEGFKLSVQAPKEAVAARNSGVSKEALLAATQKTAREAWMTDLLTSIVHEVYDYPVLPAQSYAAYRFELCFLSQQHEGLAAPDFAAAHGLLMQCPDTQDKEQALCAMKVAHTVTGIPVAESGESAAAPSP